MTTITIQGTICGRLWWPSGALGWRSFKITLGDAPFQVQASSLREALLSSEVTGTGDFESASLVDAILTVTRRRGSREVCRSWDLASLPLFPSIADLWASEEDRLEAAVCEMEAFA